MADFLPPVVARLLGDTSDFTSKWAAAPGTVDKTAGETEGRLSRMRSTIGSHMTAVGGFVTGAGVALTELGGHAQQSEAMLKTAVENAGGSMEEMDPKVAKLRGSMLGLGFANNETNDALAKLTIGFQDPNKALGDMGLAADIARTRHISLSAAADMLVKAHAGSTRILKQFGIEAANTKQIDKDLESAHKDVATASDTLAAKKLALSDLEERLHGVTKLSVSQQQALRNAHSAVTDSTDKLAKAKDKEAAAQRASAAATSKGSVEAQIGARISGQAAAQADTMSGKIQSLKVHVEAWAEGMAKKAGPALTAMGPAMMGVSAVASSGLVPALISGVGAFFSFAASAVAAGIGAAAAALPIIIAWAPVILAIAAVGAAGYLLYTQWDNVMAGLKIIVNDVVGFVSDHWRLLVDIILGPLGLIITNWDTIWHTFTGVVSAVWDGVSGVVKGGINDVIGLINGFIDGIDSIEIHIPSVGIGPLRSPGFDWGGLGIPNIPKLARGGTAINAGWAVVGDEGPELMHMPRGAEVAPLHAGAGGGNVYNLHVEVTGTVLGSDTRKLAQQLVDPLRTELHRAGDRQSLKLPA